MTGPNRGRGVAAGFWFNGGLQSAAAVNLHNDGTLSVVTGSVDIGGSRAAMAMVAAEVLGVEAEDVRPIVADTDSIGHTDVTGGSRITLATGMAVYEAAEDVVRQLKERAAKLWEKKPEEIEFNNGRLSAIGNGVKPMTIKEIVPRLARTGGPITGRATLNAGAVGAVGNAFALTCVDVEVDPDTGKVKILRCAVAQDVGRAIHPAYVEGQLQGATAQGIGWALNEEYVYDERGIMRNTGLLDYRMPTCLDLPMIETIIVEVPNPSHPLGVRGVGEVSIVLADGGGRERHLPRRRSADDRVADVTAEIAQGDAAASADQRGSCIRRPPTDTNRSLNSRSVRGAACRDGWRAPKSRALRLSKAALVSLGQNCGNRA